MGITQELLLPHKKCYIVLGVQYSTQSNPLGKPFKTIIPPQLY